MSDSQDSTLKPDAVRVAEIQHDTAVETAIIARAVEKRKDWFSLITGIPSALATLAAMFFAWDANVRSKDAELVVGRAYDRPTMSRRLIESQDVPISYTGGALQLKDQIINFAEEQWGGKDSWDANKHAFKAPETGVYQVTASVTVQSVTQVSVFVAIDELEPNDPRWHVFSNVTARTTETNVTAAGSTIVDLKKGQLVFIGAIIYKDGTLRPTNANVLNLDGVPTTASMHLLSREITK